MLRLLRGPDRGDSVGEGITWEPYSGPSVDQEGIERHWAGVNPHSPCPSLTPAGHNKARPPSPASPRWPLTLRLRLLSLAPLCLRPVIISNIYSFWFPCRPLSLPTQHSWLTGKLKCSPSYSSITSKTLKPLANTTWSGKQAILQPLICGFPIEATRSRTDEQQPMNERVSGINFKYSAMKIFTHRKHFEKKRLEVVRVIQ